MSKPLVIVIPFYRNATLVEPLFASLRACSRELVSLQTTLIAINDSPDDGTLAIALSNATRELSDVVPCRLIENSQNIGFVKSVNSGLTIAVLAGADVVLLNSDTEIYPGAITEMQQVASLDSMIGFVSPRTNNATICSFPHQEEFRHLRPAEGWSVFRELSPYLPRFQYVPTAVGFCMYIKLEILLEFGYLDEIYGKGYNEENDLVMRANRCGYRAVLANHAYVYHVGESSFSISDSPKNQSEERNAAILVARYPEYPTHVQAYIRSGRYRAEILLRGLLKDSHGRYDIIFDFSSFGAYHNGTFEAGKQILMHAAQSWNHMFNIHVLVDEEAARFHGFHSIPGIFRVPPNSSAVFALAFRFGQPFEYNVVARMSELAVVNVYSMLDPIAWDCLYLNRDDLHELWQTVFSYSDGVSYISEFVEQQFRSRFRYRPGLKEMVSYLSLDTRDYFENENGPKQGDYLLIVGNAFAHKHIQPTVDALARAFPRQKIVALGLDGTRNQNILGYKSGQLSEEELNGLFVNAGAVIFPSFYEGFGIPIIRGLSFQKPLLARSSAVNRELAERLDNPEDFILYNSTDELIQRLRDGIPSWKGSVRSLRGRYDWITLTRNLGEFLRMLIDEISLNDILVPRIDFIELLRKAGLLNLEEGRNLAPSTTSLQFGGGLGGGAYEQPIEDGEQGIQDLNQRNSELSRQMDERREHMAELKSQLQSAELLADTFRNRVRDLELAVRDRDLRIQAFRSSLSWILTAPLRSAGSLWLKIFDRTSAGER